MIVVNTAKLVVRLTVYSCNDINNNLKVISYENKIIYIKKKYNC